MNHRQLSKGDLSALHARCWNIELDLRNLLTNDGKSRQWDMLTRTVLREFADCRLPATSADCSKIAAARDNKVMVWDRNSGRELACFTPYGEKAVAFVAFAAADTLMSLGGDGILKRYPLGRDPW